MANYDFRPLEHRASSARNILEMEATKSKSDDLENDPSTRSIQNEKPASVDITDHRSISRKEETSSHSNRNMNQTWNMNHTQSHETIRERQTTETFQRNPDVSLYHSDDSENEADDSENEASFIPASNSNQSLDRSRPVYLKFFNE